MEDNPDAREVLSTILAAEGFSVMIAEDGQQALDLVQAEPPDGIEMIKRLRAHRESRAVPIVVMSAFGSAVTKYALDAGASRSTPKPMQVDSLLNIVRQLLF